MSQEKPLILLIDDELDYRKNFTKMCKANIQEDLCEVIAIGSGIQGFKILDENILRKRKTLAYTDIILPDINSDELITGKNYDKEIIEIVLLSAHKNISEMKQIQKKHKCITEVYEKPTKNAVVIDRFKSFIEKNNIAQAYISSNNFSYENFDDELTSYLRQEASTIKTIMKRTVDNTLELGKKLIKIKEILPYGSFQNWINQELGLHKTTANHFMRVWDVFGHRQDVIRNSGLSVTIIYLLSAPSTTEDFRTKVIELANSGTSISSDMVKKLKKTYDRKHSEKKTAKEENTTISTIDVVSTPDDSNIEQNIQQEPVKNTESKQQIVSVIRKNPEINTFKKLGRHLLFCGLPTNPDFIEKCPPKISLNVAFPNEHNINDINTLFPVSSKTKVMFQSDIPDTDIDLFTFTEIIRNSIEIYTEGGSTILYSYLPYPKLLMLAHNLECNCFIAEPDVNRFKNIVYAWKKEHSREAE